MYLFIYLFIYIYIYNYIDTHLQAAKPESNYQQLCRPHQSYAAHSPSLFLAIPSLIPSDMTPSKMN